MLELIRYGFFNHVLPVPVKEAYSKVEGLPRTPAGYDSVWVIVDRLTKVAHFLPVKASYTAERLAELYHDGSRSTSWGTKVDYLISRYPFNLRRFGRVCMKLWEL